VKKIRRILFNKQTGILTLSFLLIAAFIVIWTDSKQLQSALLPEPITAPQWYATEVTNIQMNQEGQPERIAVASKMVHQDQNNTTMLTQPHLSLYRADSKEPWQVNAKRGIVYHGAALNEINQLDLLENVVLKHLETSSKKLLQAKTETFTIHPLTNEGYTDELVTITQPGQLLQGTGMKVYFDKEQMNLLSKVKTQYEMDN